MDRLVYLIILNRPIYFLYRSSGGLKYFGPMPFQTAQAQFAEVFAPLFSKNGCLSAGNQRPESRQAEKTIGYEDFGI
jgi:hypothetical protein